MAAIDLLIARRLDVPLMDTPRAWPQGSASIEIVIDATSFMDGDQCAAEIELSWDNGKTWTGRCRAVFDGGAVTPNPDNPGRPARSMTVGAFTRATKDQPDGGIQNPTHYRLTLRALKGRPVIGAKGRD